MVAREEVACAACGETILAVAKKCKHCGEWYVGTPAADSTSGFETGVNGRSLRTVSFYIRPRPDALNVGTFVLIDAHGNTLGTVGFGQPPLALRLAPGRHHLKCGARFLRKFALSVDVADKSDEQRVALVWNGNGWDTSHEPAATNSEPIPVRQATTTAPVQKAGSRVAGFVLNAAATFIALSGIGGMASGEYIAGLLTIAMASLFFTPIWKRVRLGWKARTFAGFSLAIVVGAVADKDASDSASPSALTVESSAQNSRTEPSRATVNVSLAEPGGRTRDTEPTPTPKRPRLLERLRSPSTIAEARSWVLGEWTSVGERYGQPDKQWVYLRIDEDGKSLWCTAKQDDTQWSDCAWFTYDFFETRYGSGPVISMKFSPAPSNPLRSREVSIDGVELSGFVDYDSEYSHNKFRRGNKHPNGVQRPK